MDGRVALITGASSGIGRATATAFAEAGARVVAAARREEELASLTEEIRDRGGEATWVRADVADRADVEAMVAHAVDAYGCLDVAVNNAGIEGALHPVTEFPEDEFDRVMAINLKGMFLCMKYEARAILAGERGGAIVNVGSVNSFLGFPTGTAYVGSKHAQVGITTCASAELAPRGIRVNIVCPGIVDTPMHRRLRSVVGDELYEQAFRERVHVGRAGRPEEIARTILFLSSDDASFITGTTVTPDGGLMMTL